MAEAIARDKFIGYLLTTLNYSSSLNRHNFIRDICEKDLSKIILIACEYIDKDTDGKIGMSIALTSAEKHQWVYNNVIDFVENEAHISLTEFIRAFVSGVIEQYCLISNGKSTLNDINTIVAQTQQKPAAPAPKAKRGIFSHKK